MATRPPLYSLPGQALALAAAGLAWRQLPQPGTPGHLFSLLCLGFVLVSSLGAAHWRRLHPASYAAHREWRLACARVSLSGWQRGAVARV